MSLSQFSIPQILKKNHSFITVFLSLGILLSGCTSDSNSEESSVTQDSSAAAHTQITVSATIFPIYDILRQIAGEMVTTELILQPGESPHTFNMTPSVKKIIDKSDLIFVVGHGLDNWIVNSYDVVTVDTDITLRTSDDDEHHDHNGSDPHYWLAPENASIIATNIAAALAELDPNNKAAYEVRAAKFHAEMTSLKIKLLNEVTSIKAFSFIMLHNSFAYFAEAFGLNIAGSFEPIGAEEPSPRYLKKLTDTVEEQNVKAIFSEPQLSANSLTAFINDNNLQTNILDPIGGVEGRETYQALLKYNIRTLTSTLAK